MAGLEVRQAKPGIRAALVVARMDSPRLAGLEIQPVGLELRGKEATEVGAHRMARLIPHQAGAVVLVVLVATPRSGTAGAQAERRSPLR